MAITGKVLNGRNPNNVRSIPVGRNADFFQSSYSGGYATLGHQRPHGLQQAVEQLLVAAFLASQ